MRNISRSLLILAVCFGLVGVASVALAHEHDAQPAAKSAKKYACPMGCKVMDHPGACPVCGMQMSEIKDDDADAAPAEAASGDPYYLAKSPTGRTLGPKPLIVSYKGRELRFADELDKDAFDRDPDKYLSAVDEKMVADQLPYYALKTCPITGEELTDPVNYIYNNRLVRFCCAGCIEEFTSNPGKYLKQLDDAAKAAQAPTYPLANCIVKTDEAIDGKDDSVIASRLFRFCCPDCVSDVRANPAKFIAELDAARTK